MSVRRTQAVINEALDLRVAFRYDDLTTLFDPAEISLVEILDDDATTVLETFVPPNITRLSLGRYQIITSPLWNTAPKTVYDRWIFKKEVGGQNYSIMQSTVINLTYVPTPPAPGIPTALEIRNYLQGYNMTDCIISDEWIEEARDFEVIPFIEKQARTNLTAEETVEEYHNGISWDRIILDRKNAISLVSVKLVSGEDISGVIDLSALELIQGAGIVKVKSGLSEYYNYRTFPKGNDNIKITYKCGGVVNNDLALAIKKLTCVLILDLIEGRTGGGSLTVQSFGRDYGNMGKYSNIRKRLYYQAMNIIRRYSTAVVGS